MKKSFANSKIFFPKVHKTPLKIIGIILQIGLVKEYDTTEPEHAQKWIKEWSAVQEVSEGGDEIRVVC